MGAVLKALGLDGEDWRADALCAEVGGDMWFPDKNSNESVNNHVRQAKAICRQCPVAVQCLQFALDNQEYYGIWGGLTYRERRAWVKKQSASNKRIA